VIRLRANGIGIAPSALEEVLHLFSQAGTSATQATEGLGIGLSLVRTLVEMHGGSARASSDGPGKGSTFIVRLPIVEGVIGEPPTPAPVHMHQRAQRILVVDDNADAQSPLLCCLRRWDMRCIRPPMLGGHCAVTRVRPGYYFIDIGMPLLDGLETTRRIRALPTWVARTHRCAHRLGTGSRLQRTR
jgi:hypothetical protein